MDWIKLCKGAWIKILRYASTLRLKCQCTCTKPYKKSSHKAYFTPYKANFE